MFTGVAIIISTGFATLGWLYTGRLQRLMDRRQHTYRIIIRQQDDEKFSVALERIRSLLEKGKIPRPDDETSREDVDKIDYLLNHYEFIAAAIWVGDVDEQLMKLCEYSRITKLHVKMADYINDCREYREQPTMFENLESLSSRWTDANQTLGEKVYEFVWLKPCRNCPPWAERINYWHAWVKNIRRSPN